MLSLGSRNVCRVNVKRQGLYVKQQEYSQAHCKIADSSQAINTVKANSRSHKNTIAMTRTAAVSKIRVTIYRTGPQHPKQLIALHTEVIRLDVAKDAETGRLALGAFCLEAFSSLEQA